MGLSAFNFTQLFSESQEKMFKTSVNARPQSFNIFFLENPSKYPQDLALRETRVPAEDLHCWQCVSIFISFHAITFRKSPGWSQPNWRKNRF